MFAVFLRTRTMLAVALGLWMGHHALAQEPGPFSVERGHTLATHTPASVNQSLADTVAGQLRQSGQIHHYNVDLVVRQGTVEVTGTVADQPQREEVLRVVQGVPGVERVVDRLVLTDGLAQTQVKVEGEPPGTLKEPSPLPKGPDLGSPAGPPLNPPAAEPTPIFAAPMPSPYDVATPKMPPYAWPTYAPYNNYSRVAYPQAYPYNAWPFIGPVYPFPKVPLGWRSVKLQWDDGHWWFSKTATKYDWWHLRYW
jgi:hypothetical protein